MMLKNIKKIFLFVVLGISLSAHSQSASDFEEKYNAAKLLLNQKQYEQAIQHFEPLCKVVDLNPYSPYAMFYKAKAFIGLEKYAEARFVLVKLGNDFPKWAKQEEVTYLLAYAQLHSKQYIEAKTSVERIKNDFLSTKAKAMFYSFVVQEDSTVLLSNLQQKNKKDKELAEIIAHKLKASSSPQDAFLLNYLIQDYGLEAEKFGGKSGVKKDKYQIALLLPLNLDKKSAYRNIKILSILKGVEYAIDSLNDLGQNIELKVFDTERDLDKLTTLLNSNEFQNIDLILGPLEIKACELVANYSEEHKIINFNYNREDKLFEDREFIFSSISSNKTIGRELAKSAHNSFDTLKPVEIYYHLTASKEDSIIAKSYKDEIEKSGMKVSVFMAVDDKNEDAIKSFRKKISIGDQRTREVNGRTERIEREERISHIAVFAQKHNLMASTLISVWEREDRTAPVVAPKEWLDIHLIGYDQFKRRNFHFAFLEYISSSNENIKPIKQKYQNEFGVRPTELKYIAVGYDVAFFVGNQLNEYGTFFHKELYENGNVKAVLTPGIDLTTSKTNSNVPLLKFGEEFEFENISKKEN